MVSVPLLCLRDSQNPKVGGYDPELLGEENFEKKELLPRKRGCQGGKAEEILYRSLSGHEKEKGVGGSERNLFLLLE